MKTPVIFIAGFLESGKTTYINTYLKTISCGSDFRILIVSFEEGMQKYEIPQKFEKYIKVDTFASLDSIPYRYFENASVLYDTILVEYNGTWKIAEFMKLAFMKTLDLQRVVCMANAETFAMYIKNIDTFAEHIMNANQVMFTNLKKISEQKEIKRCIYQLQPSADILLFENNEIKRLQHVGNMQKIYSKWFLPVLLILIAGFVILYHRHVIQLSHLINFQRMLFSIILQAMPFLLIGIVCSSILQIYVSDERFIKFIAKHQILALPLLILSGCMLPLCDCAMVPLTEKFIQKGISVPLAMVFFCISSSINPIVIVSTYYAFPENPIYIWLRLLLSIIVALIIGFCFYIYGKWKKGSVLKTSSLYLEKSYEYDIQQCMEKGKMGKFTAFGLHISNEFFRIMVYVIIGALLSTIVQLIHTSNPSLFVLSNGGFALIYMLFASLFLSICASSNAFIAKGFTNTLAISAVFPFMIFGPLLDIKNLLILSSRFNKRFMFVYTTVLLFLFISMTIVLAKVL